MKIKVADKEFSVLIVIHGFLAFCLPFIVLFLSSCLEAQEDPIPFGPKESAESINDALSEPFASLNVESIFKDEFVHVETNQQVFGGTKFVTKDTGITVINRKESGELIELTLAIEEYEYDIDGNSEHVIFEDTVNIKKSSASSAALAMNVLGSPKMMQNTNQKVQALAESVGLCEPTNHPSVTFHNLQVERTTQDPPSKVLNSTFCAEGSSCKLSVAKIRFDEVFWDGDSGTKIKCEYTYSSQVPYLASQLKYCVTLVVPSGERSLLLTECREVQNFNQGAAN